MHKLLSMTLLLVIAGGAMAATTSLPAEILAVGPEWSPLD